MDEEQVLYAITVEDVINLSEELNILFEEKDLIFIEDKIGNFMESHWSDAVEYALQELKAKRKKPK